MLFEASRARRKPSSPIAPLTAGPLVQYGYDDLSRRISITRANGASSAYSYYDNGALATLGHGIGGGGSVGYGYTYNRVLQVTSRTTDNDLYAWTDHQNISQAYVPNGLDQYANVAYYPYRWDARGNLLAGLNWSYGYDGENRLTNVVRASAHPGRPIRSRLAGAAQAGDDADALLATLDADEGA